MVSHKSNFFVWKRAGVGILSLFLAFVLTTSLGMLPFVFGQSNGSSGAGQVATQTDLAETVVKSVNPEGGTSLSPNQTVGVSLNITGSNSTVSSKVMDMMLVLDATGSMTNDDGSGNQSKWDGLKNSVGGLITLFNQFNQGGNLRLGAIVFNSNIGTQAFSDSQGNFTTNYNAISGFLDKLIKPDGGTNIGQALQKTASAFAHFKDIDPNRYNQSRKITVLVSDGVHNMGIDPTNDTVLAPFRLPGIANSIGIYTIGYGQTRNFPDNVIGVDYNIGQKYLWCDPAKGGAGPPYEVFSQNNPTYCLAREIVNPPSPDVNGVFGNRLNGLAIRTGGQAYYGSTASDINGFLEKIFNSVGGATSAIEVIEKFDSHFTLQSGIKFSGVDLTQVNSIDEVMTISNSYFVSTTDNLLHIVISPNAISNMDNLTIQFSFIAPSNATGGYCNNKINQVGIDTSGSKVIWGNINALNDPQVITGGTEKSLDERCYGINQQSAGDVYFQNPFNLNFSANLMVLGFNGQGLSGSLATLLGYGFKPKTQSEQAQFKNQLEALVNYLYQEQPYKVTALAPGEGVNLLNLSANSNKMIVAKNSNINITGINGNNSMVAIVTKGGNITFDNVIEFHGVAIALPGDSGGGVIDIAGADFTLQGSLVANEITSSTSANFNLKSFDKSNYLTQIPGLAPILNKIYSFYASE